MHITVILITYMPKRRRNQSESNDEYFEVTALRRKLREGCSIEFEEDAANPFYEALWIDANGNKLHGDS